MNIIRKKINSIGRKLLPSLPFGRCIMSSISSNRVINKNLGKIKFQGQWLQDMIAYMYFSEIKNGFYIEIGANDGVMYSNTYVFEQLGWRGICVEPQKDIFEKYLTKYRKCDCRNVAISSKSEENAEFLLATGFNPISGLTVGMDDEHKNWTKEHGAIEMIKVKTITFDELMSNYPDVTVIDFISIDVEGHESEILNSIDFSKYKFRFLLIENNEPEKIKNILEMNGYKEVMKIGLDIIFIPKDKDFDFMVFTLSHKQQN
jgi:FkbM family methyltransferase